jgi:hypothetical protein
MKITAIHSIQGLQGTEDSNLYSALWQCRGTYSSIYPEDGGISSFQNVCTHLPDYTVSEALAHIYNLPELFSSHTVEISKSLLY